MERNDVLNELPLVSVLIPCYNEESFLEKCVESVLKNDYPRDRMEIYIIDGMSSDKTPEIALQMASGNTNIKVLKNEKRIFPAAINLGYALSGGDVIMILGAHAEYSANYISGNVRALYEQGVDNVGGLVEQIWPGQNIAGNAITMVLSSRFGIGGATYRTGTDTPLLVDTVFGGCYRRDVFERIGIFNEKLVSSSDIDFNTRLKKAGGKTLLIPHVRVFYHYAETNYSKFIRNNFRNGYWTVNPMKYLNYIPVRFRHLVPLFFVSGITGAALLSLLSVYFFWILAAVAVVYLAAAYYFSLTFAKRGFIYFLILPFFFFSLHFSYGLGSLTALFSLVLYRITSLFVKR